MMKFVGIIERETTITIDGYSNRKTVRGALNELAKEVAKYDDSEANCITDLTKFDIEDLALLENCSHMDYYVGYEEVPCATNINEETEEMEYADGRYYMMIRFIKKDNGGHQI